MLLFFNGLWMEYSDRCEISNDDLQPFEDIHDKRDEVMSIKYVRYYQLSYDQLWAALLIGRNAVTWLSIIICSLFHVQPGWHYNVTPDDREAVTWRSLNANVRYILRCFCLRFVCFFVIRQNIWHTVVRGTCKYAPLWDIFNIGRHFSMSHSLPCVTC